MNTTIVTGLDGAPAVVSSPGDNTVAAHLDTLLQHALTGPVDTWLTPKDTDGGITPIFITHADHEQVAVAIAGTLNDASDTDSLWTTEIALPFAAFTGYRPHLPPRPGDVWRLNLYRTGGAVNLQYITWSDTQRPQPQFHAPERFGYAHFLGPTAD